MLSRLLLFKIPVDLVLIFAAFAMAYYLRDNPIFLQDFLAKRNDLLPWEDYDSFAYQGTALLFIMLILSGFYSLKKPIVGPKVIPHVWVVVTAWLMLIIGYFFFTRQLFFSRLVIVYIYVFSLSFLYSSQVFFTLVSYIMRRLGYKRRKVLFIGTGDVINRISVHLAKSGEYTIIGTLDIQKRSAPKRSVKIIDSIVRLRDIIDYYKVDVIIQADSSLAPSSEESVYEVCRDKNITYQFVPDIIHRYSKNIEVKDVDSLPVMEIKPSPLEAWGAIYKEIFDRFAALCGLIVLSPVFWFIALLIKWDSKWPVIYKSTRVGQYGQLIPFYKFRSMVLDADKQKKQLESQRKGPLFKMKNDPRITRIGKVLRKTSLDELPQLFSVVKGDMSLVGPRAHLPEEVAQYKKGQKFVLSIKPGITGMAQVSGRSDIEFDEEARLDTLYIEDWSLLLDLVIIFKTIFVVLKPSHSE